MALHRKQRAVADAAPQFVRIPTSRASGRAVGYSLHEAAPRAQRVYAKRFAAGDRSRKISSLQLRACFALCVLLYFGAIYFADDIASIGRVVGSEQSGQNFFVHSLRPRGRGNVRVGRAVDAKKMEATPVPTATPVPADNELEQQQQDDPPTDIPEVETQPPEVEHDATAEKEEAQATDPLTQPDTATQEQSAHHDEQMTDDRLKDDSPGDAVHPDDQGDQRGQGQADQGDHGDQGEQGNQGDQAGGNDQVSGVQADPAEAFSIETQLPVDQIQEGFAQGKQAEKAATPSTVRVDPIEPHPKVQELKQDDSLAAADTHTTQDQPHPTAAARHPDKEEGDAIPAASPARGEKQNIQGIVNETPRQPNQPGRGDAKPSAAPTPLNVQQGEQLAQTEQTTGTATPARARESIAEHISDI